jgi:hypothetical protein
MKKHCQLCNTEFHPIQNTQRYCSKKCKRKVDKLKRKQKPPTPEQKEQRREQVRRYHEKIKADPERYAVFVEQSREHSKRKHWANKERENARCRQFHYKKKEQLKMAKQMLSSREVAILLGINPGTLNSWERQGKLIPVRTPGGFRRFDRAVVESLIPKGDSGLHLSVVARKFENVFEAPPGFDVITTYAELKEYTLGFANGHIPFLLLVGTPGSGKSSQMKADLEGKHIKWIDNHATTLGLYCAVYEANNRPVVLDDVNHFISSKLSCSLMKALTQTEKKGKHISWESPTKILEDREVPRDYVTKSPICMIGNMWDSKNADYAAIQDRALPVAFCPTAQTIHDRVLELGWCKDKEITTWIGERLTDCPQPSMRHYYSAGCYKRAGMDWRKKLQATWEQGT